MLPLGGLAMAVFAGWFMSKQSTMDELGMGDNLVFKGWHFLVRYVTPLAVIAVFLQLLGVV